MISVKNNQIKIFVFFIGAVIFSLALIFLAIRPGARRASEINVSGDQQGSQTPLTDCEINSACPDCNIVLISVDSLRADHMSSFGYGRKTTPFFDEFSKRGLLFQNYFSASYLTPISEMSLHTGMYPSANGLVHFSSILPKNIITLAQFLKKEGYVTDAMHTSPEFGGKEEVRSSTAVPDFVNIMTGIKESFQRGFDKYRRQEIRDFTGISTSAIYGNLEALKPNKFFFWVTFGNVHWPYNDKEPNLYADPNYNGIFKDQRVTWSVLRNIYKNIVYPGGSSFLKSDLDYLVDNYDNSINAFDDFLKGFIDKLSKEDLLEKTIIIIESEHGEGFNERGYIAHYDIYDEQVHVPLLIFSPKIGSGKKINKFSGSVDVLPTLAALIGRTPPPQVQGRNMVPVFCRNERSQSNEDLGEAFIERIPLWEQTATDLIKIIEQMGMDPRATVGDIAIRTNEWKYILRNSKDYLQKVSWWSRLTGEAADIPAEELYNIINDPGELNNVAGSYPEVVDDLKRKLIDWREKNPDRSDMNNNRVIQEYF